MASLMKKLERVPTDVIQVHPRNARKGNVEIIAESLKENEQYAPLVVQKSTGYVLSGNHTLLAARSLGWPEIDVVYVDVDENHATRIMLAANKTADHGEYDDAALLDLLESLDDLEGTGYSMDDLDDLMAGMDKFEETPFEETLAAYTETDEELAKRSQKLSEIKSQDSQGLRETVLVLSQEQHEELHGLLQAVKRHLEGEGLTNGEVMLRCARTLGVIADIYHSHEPSCDCEWCKVARASESPIG